MMMVFRTFVWINLVLEGQIANKYYFLETLAILCKWVRRKRPNFWKNKSWIRFLHRDNASFHTVLAVKTYLAKHRISQLEYPSSSADLAPCDFLFLKAKVVIKPVFNWLILCSRKDVMNMLTQNDFQYFFDQWKFNTEWFCWDSGGENNYWRR